MQIGDIEPVSCGSVIVIVRPSPTKCTVTVISGFPIGGLIIEL